VSATDSFTAGDVHKHVLFEAMDARATNVRQTELLYNPSPEVDSVIEHLVALEHKVGREALAPVVTLIKELLQANLAEGQHEMAIAGFADRMANHMRGQETGAW
jgi:hypothetical protein